MRKHILFFLTLTLLIKIEQTKAQHLNWHNLDSNQKHILRLHTGWDYAVSFGAGYSHKLKTKLPVLLNADLSIPSGKDIGDDFKTKIGGQARIFEKRSFQLSAGLSGIYRRYENPLVIFKNFGTELNIAAGFYKKRWFAAAEFTFDKAFATHFKHSDVFRENIYANAQDGWQTNTGGNFMYGVAAGYSFNNSDLVLKFGKINAQDFKSSPLIPYYLQLGYNFKFGKSK